MDLTIAICTRNRINDLQKLILSLSKQEKVDAKIELLIIDDGEIIEDKLNEFKKLCKDYDFFYYKKTSPGLFKSRLKAIELSKADKILFLDDDVTIDKNYIKVLLQTYEKFPKAAGIGGVDYLLKNYSLFRKIYSIIFLYNSNDKAKLSLSMMNSSMYLWQKEKKSFKSEFLDGCNMSFRKDAIKDIKEERYFENYSLGEDIFLSLWVKKKGDLIVNPALKVKHFKSPASRDKIEKVAFMKIINHYKLLKHSKRGKYKYITIWWTYAGYILASLLKRDFREIKGYLRGMACIVRDNIF